MDPKENPGLSDETIGKFGEFIKMAEENLYLSEVETEEVPSQILETPKLMVQQPWSIVSLSAFIGNCAFGYVWIKEILESFLFCMYLGSLQS